MEFESVVFGGVLILVSAGLTACHLTARRRGDESGQSEKQLAYARGRFRRRMQASLMIGLAGVAIVIGQWIPQTPEIYLFYWLSVAGLVLWIVALALADMLATRIHYSRIRREQLIEQARLRVDLRQQLQRRNGHDREAEEALPGSSDQR